MSFAYLPLYTGDYLRDTRHLTPLKHGVYMLLLMHCWDQKGPVPLDEQEAAGITNCRSSDEVEALRYILNRYFVRMDDGWYNTRMMRQLQQSEAISHNRAEAGRMGGLARAAKDAKQVLSKCQASAKHEPVSPSPSPSLNQEESKPKTHTRFSAREYLLSKGVDEQTTQDYLAIRRAKKLTPTLKALESIQTEAEKAGISFGKAIETCCVESWAGFKASWMEKATSVAKQPWEGAV